jgi:hypothetical protein
MKELVLSVDRGEGPPSLQRAAAAAAPVVGSPLGALPLMRDVMLSEDLQRAARVMQFMDFTAAQQCTHNA